MRARRRARRSPRVPASIKDSLPEPWRGATLQRGGRRFYRHRRGVEAVHPRRLLRRDEPVAEVGEHERARPVPGVAVAAAVCRVDPDEIALVELERRRDRMLFARAVAPDQLDVVARALAPAVEGPRRVDAAGVGAREEEAVGAGAVVEHDALAAAVLARPAP